MMKSRTGVVVAVFVSIAVSGCGDSEDNKVGHRLSSSTVVSIQDLKQGISAQRLKAKYFAVGEGSSDVKQLVGIVKLAGDPTGPELGFEFRVHSKSNSVTARGLGKLSSFLMKRGKWNKPGDIPEGEIFLTNVRGVVGNVAYATYDISHTGSVGENTLLLQKLDDALFGLFPKGDSEAYPILQKP